MDEFLASDGDEYLTRVVVDIASRTFRMYSNEGEVREVDCETSEEFMDVLEFIRDFEEVGLLDSDMIAYSEPPVSV